MLERLDEAAAFFGGGEWYRRVFNAVHISVNRWFFMPSHYKGIEGSSG